MSNGNETKVEIALPQWARSLPFLSNFQTPLPRLAEPAAQDLDATLGLFGQLLGAPSEPLAVRIQISEGEQQRSWLLDAGPDGCRVTEDDNRPPDVEAMLDAETWRLIANGEISPLEAFGRGRMRVRGDLRAARRLAGQLYRTDSTQS
jgi:putative sterol carrier protein